MPFTLKHKERHLGRRIVKYTLAVIILGLGFDFGKHVVLKRVLEKEIAQSQGLISLESISVSFWPLFQNHLDLKNFRVNLSGTPLATETIHIRQGWCDWHLAHIQARGVKVDESVLIQGATGILDITDLNSRINVSQLVLTGIQAKLPLIAFSGAQASFDFLYEMETHQLTLKGDAPEMSFPNGAAFGLNGEGAIHTQAPMQGKFNLKIQNIDKMMKELVAAGVVNASQADLITTGSNFLSQIGLHDLTLPLTIQDGLVSLGPVVLFRVGKQEMNG